MIVNTGKTKLLDSQLSTLAGYYWALFTNNFTIAAGTVWADLTEAAWTGYARVLAGSWGASAIVGGRATTVPASYPSFSNGSGGTVTFYGWALIDSSGPTLIAAVNIGATIIPDGQAFLLAPAVTDTQE